MRGGLLTFLAIAILCFLPGCMPDKVQKELARWRVSLDKENKHPYGANIAYQSLRYYFPDAEIEAVPHGFRYTNMDDKMKFNFNGRTLFILAGLDFYLSEEEWKALKQVIFNGNEVIIFCSRLDKKIEEDLGCYKERNGEEERLFYLPAQQEFNKNILSLAGDPDKRYGYYGRSLGGFFSFNDTADHPEGANDKSEHETRTYETLGMAGHNPDFVRYRIGEGHLAIHAAPLVLSNYFLLQDSNRAYLTGVMQTLPEHINRVYWDDYFRRDAALANFDVLWRYPASNWALRIGIFALLVYVLFEGKRKQRIVPVIAPLKNVSVSFVATVGRLYYNKGNHANLAEKMVQQFLEWVRMHYFLNTNLLNEDFIHLLTVKSGQQEATVRGLAEMIHEIKLGSAKVDDAYLYQLYNTIQRFYKNHN